MTNKTDILWNKYCIASKIRNFNISYSSIKFKALQKEMLLKFKTINEWSLKNYERIKKVEYHDKPINMDVNYKYIIDGELAHWLDILTLDAKEDNDDALLVIVGPEGAGKSYFASQIADYISLKLKVPVTLDNIHFEGEGYLNSSVRGVPLQINILDESRRVLNRLRSNSKSNVDFMNYFSECRDQNQIHILLLPAFTDLDSSAGVWRSKMLLSVEKYRDPITDRIIRGNFNIWSTESKALLKKAQKERYEKLPPEMLFYSGKFDDVLCYDIKAYKAKKLTAKKERYGTPESDKQPVNMKDALEKQKFLLVDRLRKQKKSYPDIAIIIGEGGINGNYLAKWYKRKKADYEMNATTP